MRFKDTIIQGDILQAMTYVPASSIHLTFTSPPYYNAKDYGTESLFSSYGAYLDFLTTTFEGVHRVTMEGRFLVLNTSPVIVPRPSRAGQSRRLPIPFDIHPRLLEMGWEFIDDIVWMKPEASVKNRNGGFYQHRKPLGYKPNSVTEYLMVYRKQTKHLIDWNMRQYDPSVIEQSKVGEDYERTNVWQIAPTSHASHPAVFPLELCERVIRYWSYVGDVVFDPFAGSGTVGEACRDLGRYFLLVEQKAEYVALMKKRLGCSVLLAEGCNLE